jgi:hypothetical protein
MDIDRQAEMRRRRNRKKEGMTKHFYHTLS